MPTLISHSPQEFFALYGQLSQRNQDELFTHLRQLIEKQQSTQQTQDDALEEFIGCLAGKTDKVLTVEEMNEIAASGWAGEYQ